MRTRGSAVSFPVAAAVSSALSVLFLAVYGGTNWLAAHREHVGTLFFQWELAIIPFVPFFVLPYLSIDLFFVGAPFLCRDMNELRTWAKRVALAIIVAGICFAAFPLRCGFPPVSRGGLLGEIFGVFLGLDAPYNVVPSLHAALGLLLFDFYFRKARGAFRSVIVAWFSLIALSPVLTHQHHLVDIATGLLLGAFCLVIVRPAETMGLAAPAEWKLFSARLQPNSAVMISSPEIKILCANTHPPSRPNSLGTNAER